MVLKYHKQAFPLTFSSIVINKDLHTKKYGFSTHHFLAGENECCGEN